MLSITPDMLNHYDLFDPSGNDSFGILRVMRMKNEKLELFRKGLHVKLFILINCVRLLKCGPVLVIFVMPLVLL